MRVSLPAVEFSEDQGFRAESDLFGRADFGRGLTNLVQRAEDPQVLVLDAPWGSGKTTFLKMWAGELRRAGHPVVYFDAFEHDYIEDAFLAVAAEVIRLSNSLQRASTPAHKRYLRSAAKAGTVLVTSAAKIGVKAATLGAISSADIDALASVTSDIAGEASSKTEEYVKALLLRQATAKGAIEGFRSDLKQLSTSLNAADGEDGARKPLIFIVDELDRCRPPFGLDLLEKIKHFFSVEGIHFLLSCHLSQLEHSLRFTYGSDLDATAYLQKFYTLLIQFPPGGEHRSDRHTTKFVEHCKRSLLGNSRNHENAEMFDVLGDIAEAMDLSFRAVEKIAVSLNLALAFTPTNHLKLLPIVPVLCALKVASPQSFAKAKNGTLSLREVEEKIRFDRWPDRGSIRKQFIVDWWTYRLADDLKNHPSIDAAQYSNALMRYRIYDIDHRHRIVPIMANTVVDRFTLPPS